MAFGSLENQDVLDSFDWNSFLQSNDNSNFVDPTLTSNNPASSNSESQEAQILQERQEEREWQLILNEEREWQLMLHEEREQQRQKQLNSNFERWAAEQRSGIIPSFFCETSID